MKEKKLVTKKKLNKLSKFNKDDKPIRFDVNVPSREAICEALRTSNDFVAFAKLIKILKLTQQTESHEGFNKRLEAMLRDGQLEQNDKGAFRLTSADHFIAGIVQSHRDGYGFLIRDDKLEDLFIPNREMLKVWHGDHVLAKINGFDHRGRQEVLILEVTQRANLKVVGHLTQEAGRWFVRPDDSKIHHNIQVDPPKSKQDLGKIVTVDIQRHPTRQLAAQGKIVEVLGQYDDPGMEIEIAVRKFDVPHEFSKACLAQSERLPLEVQAGDFDERYDLRDIPFITIDGEDARDFDDAVYVQSIEVSIAGQRTAAWRLLVAIADVSHYVKDGDAIDDDAITRSTSVYFPRRVIPMLPEALSNGLCSLCPDVDRLALVCDMVIPVTGDKAGLVHAYQFYNAVIHSHARTTYNEVWSMLQHSDSEVPEGHWDLLPQMEDLYRLYQVLAASRHQRGAMGFETVETKIITDEFGKIQSIQPLVRNDAHKIIEECMLAANTSAADFMMRSKHPALYRVHEGPTAERLLSLRSFLKASGLSLGGGEQPTPHDYAVLLEQVAQRPDSGLIQSMCLRSLQQAVYTPDNAGHFGLAYTAYTHFTSPIRRYPDLLTHRVIKALIKRKRYAPSLPVFAKQQDLTVRDKELLAWDELGAICSKHERRADEASRDVQNWLKCWYMQDKLGEVFSGKVTGVTSFGIFVILDELYVEGLVHVTDLGSDYFVFNDVLHELRGEHTGKRYRLMDKVQVVVRNVSLENRRIDFALVNVAGRAPSKTKVTADASRAYTDKSQKAKKVQGKATKKKISPDSPKASSSQSKRSKHTPKDEAPKKNGRRKR